MLPTGVERTWVFPVHLRHHQLRLVCETACSINGFEVVVFQGPAIVIVGWKIRRLSSEFAGKIMKIVVLGIGSFTGNPSTEILLKGGGLFESKQTLL